MSIMRTYRVQSEWRLGGWVLMFFDCGVVVDWPQDAQSLSDNDLDDGLGSEMEDVTLHPKASCPVCHVCPDSVADCSGTSPR
jgi:hypothetical protein